MTLADLAFGLVVMLSAAWWWRVHGVREQALRLVQQHCEQQGIRWLDDTVVWRRYRFIRDGHGHRRLCREYGFEFTVTGEERYRGTIRMFGVHLAAIELEPHRFDHFPASYPEPEVSSKVAVLDDWRRKRSS